MLKYILKKILLAIPVLLGITIIDFLLMNLAGSPIDMMTGPKVTESMKAMRAAAWGLDQPIWKQYLGWLAEILQGNLGYSYKTYQPVAEMIGSHIGPNACGLVYVGESKPPAKPVACTGPIRA